MKKTILKTTILAILSALFLLGCNADEGPFISSEWDPTVQDSTLINDTVSYSLNVQPIFNSYCTSCHNETHSKLNLLSCCAFDELTIDGFSAPYIDTFTPDASKLYRHINGELSLMPPSGKIPQYEVDLIYNWIKQGGQNN